MNLTAARLRSVLDYDPATGHFVWRETIASNAVVGKTAGGPKPPKGYICITLFGRRYYAHRLAWLWMTGRWPTGDVDHRNLCRADNRWANLRQASRSENRCNQRCRRDSTSGLKGVFYHKARGTWYARIAKDGRQQHLGVFPTAADAHAAYVAAAVVIHGEFARTA